MRTRDVTLPARRAPLASGFRWRRKLAAAVALLAVSHNAMAGNILRRSSSGRTAAAASSDATAAAAAAAQAAAAARQAQSPLRRAMDAIKSFRARQDAARAAAEAAPSDVPNGLVPSSATSPGGLEVAPGAAPGTSLWQGADLPWWQITDGGRTAVTVTQNDQKAILTWKTFNVGRETDLRFDQSKGGDSAYSWIVLNRVDGSTAPSRILGSIKAEGQVYVINRNGIIFGGSSQVNVAALIASGLEINGGDQRFKDGLLSKSGIAFGGDTLPIGSVAAERGAKISVASYGQALLLGSQVVNEGSIEAPDGQVILAAGSAVFLDKSADNRRYRVEVDRGPVENTVTNMGIISTPRGNITMVGSVVDQSGLLTATTSAEANGSILLGIDYSDSLFQSAGITRQPITIQFGEGSVTQILPDEGGKKLVGSTQFTPSSVGVYGEQIHFLASSTLYAPRGNVNLSTTPATERPDALLEQLWSELGQGAGDAAAKTLDEMRSLDHTRIYLGAGARIDVSGLRDVEVPMEQNAIKAELRANELRDNPLLRDGPLRSQTVYFDGRLGVKPGFAGLSGYYDLIERDVRQLMTSGGKLSMSANEIVTRQSSVIDLSGGSVRYLDGYVRSTQLIDQTGRRVRIEDAVAGEAYAGVEGDFVVNHPRWGMSETYSSGLSRVRTRFEKGYVEGRSAGGLTLNTNPPDWYNASFDGTKPHVDPAATGAFRIFDGQIRADTVVGPKQRELPTGSTDPTRVWRERPSGATLNIQKSGDVAIADGGPQLGSDFDENSALAGSNTYQGLRDQHRLPARWFDGNTFTNVSINSGYADNGTIISGTATLNLAAGGNLVIGAGVGVDLGDGGSFTFSGKRADIDGTLRVPGGSVSVTTLDLPYNSTNGPGRDSATTRVGSTGVIDVAGRWSNDHLDGAEAPLRALDGGSVTLVGYGVALEKGSLVDASGGGRLDATGTKLSPGKGGTITIDVSKNTRPAGVSEGPLVLDGTLRGFALADGGQLTINTLFGIVIGDSLPAGAAASARLFRPDFFTRGGFSGYTLLGGQGVTVTKGTVLAPSVDALVLLDPAGGLQSGTRLSDDVREDGHRTVAARQVLPDSLRRPMTLRLSTVPASTSSTPMLTVESGASIVMPPGSTLELKSTGTISVDGSIEVPGGTIALTGVNKVGETLLNKSEVILGPNAKLLAPGYVKSTLDGAWVRHSVEPGGKIVFSASSDAVPDDALTSVSIDAGTEIDVSGIRKIADLTSAAASPQGGARYEARLVDGSAGTISIRAQKGLVAGHLLLGPAPDGRDGAGGSLDVFGGQGLVVRQHLPTGPVSAGYLTVIADRINDSGADELVLRTVKESDFGLGDTRMIVFEGDVDLHTRRSLTLFSPTISADSSAGPGRLKSVSLTSSYVQLRGGTGAAILPAQEVHADLNAELAVNADLIDLRNAIWLGCRTSGCTAGGFKTARFGNDSTGDIRLSDDVARGSGVGLFSPGALEFNSAQVYVTSRSQSFTTPSDRLERGDNDPGFLVQAGSSITVTGNGRPAPVPLSFGERLTFQAPVIVQGGVVRAPQGQIQLKGVQGPNGEPGSVTLLPGSLTSASLEGLAVLFGEVTTDGQFRGYDQPGSAPSKSVLLDAPAVAVNPGAVIDVSGGGDLLGYRFSAGNGGSNDILSSSKGFAVLPSLGAGPAPVGGVETLEDSRLKVGDSVWLQGAPGLASGYYTLLPAHYALLPGGLLVQPLGGSFASAPGTYVRPDGAVVASGYRAVTGTTIRDPGYGRFLVMSQDVFGRYSQLLPYSFNDVAQARDRDAGVLARTVNDAGTAVLSASQSLVLQGSGRFGAGEGGLLGNLDISATNIAVVGPGGTTPDGYLVLAPQALMDFGAGSVLLGGTRVATATGTAVKVNAIHVLVDTGTGAAWTGPEIILAATTSVSVADGSDIRAQGAASRDTNPLLLTGDGALLRLSTGSRVGIVRTATAGATGDLTVGKANLSAAGSLTLDGSRAIGLSQEAALSGRQLDLASDRVNLGDVPEGAQGTAIGADMIARLASSSDLLVRGHESIHLYGDLDLGHRDVSGTATLQKITLDTGLLQGEAGGAARITASELTLRNSGGGGSEATGAGTLALDVDTLYLGPGDVKLAGYGTLQGRASAIEARGVGSLSFGGSLFSLATGQIRATSGASYDLKVAGDVALTRDPSAGADAKGLGGRLAVSASTVFLDTSVVLPAGVFEATATSGALRLGSNARIDVRGVAVDFPDQVRFAPGGAIRLAALGDLNIADGAALDVSGSARGGDAGGIALTAGGQTAVQGVLSGSAAAGFGGGVFALDAAAVPDFSALNARLESGGFDASREIRLRHQDIALGAGETIRAHEVLLRSDSGTVSVAGTIAAAGTAAAPDGGIIRLVGGDGVVITGTLDAKAGAMLAAGFEPSSGKVEIVATGGTVDVRSGAVVDVKGWDSHLGWIDTGTVVVRAPQGHNGNPNDVAIEHLDGTFRGARQVAVQGVQRYQPQGGVVDVGLIGVGDAQHPASLLGDAFTWLRDSSVTIKNRFASVPNLQVGAGILVTSSGGITINDPIDLHGQLGAGYLGFVAEGGNITVDAAVSDGFATSARDAALLGGRSASYPFSARYSFDASGDVELTARGMIRTGTGDISIRAGSDLKLDAPTSVIYTAGTKTDPAPGFSYRPLPIVEFPTGGGDITIRAGRDVVVAQLPSQTTSAWLFREGATDPQSDAPKVTQQTSWSIVYKNFEQGIGALGGGDVRVSAGHDIVRLQVSIPTTGQLTTDTTQPKVAGENELVVLGGGNLEVSAGHDILGGLFMLGRGHADLHAGGSVRASPDTTMLRGSYLSSSLTRSSKVGALFGLMDATASVTAISSVDIEGAFDPMRQKQIGENLANGTTGSAFWGYTDRTALSATSVTGSVSYENDPWASADLSSSPYQVSMSGNGITALNEAFSRAPATLRFSSLESSVFLKDAFGAKGTLTMAPSSQGTLELLAKEDVRLGVHVKMEDIAPSYRRGPLAPIPTTTTASGDILQQKDLNSAATNYLRGPTAIHAEDPAPARIYALEGSVCADLSGACLPGRPLNTKSNGALVVLPKPIDVFAGKDVYVGDYQVQHNGPSALSRITAGRDVYDVGLEVTGAGAALVEAGRDVVEHALTTAGPNPAAEPWGGVILSRGNGASTGKANSALPRDRAADVYIMAGTAGGVAYDAFAAAYLDPENRQGVVRTYLPELADYMKGLDAKKYGSISGADLVAAFNALAPARREIFLDRIYFTELKETGIDYNDPKGPRFHSYDRGFRAVSLLFPRDPSTASAMQRGDVILASKSLETQARGDITVLAPYGHVEIGLAFPPGKYDSAKGGVVTRRGGDIRIMADRDINLFTSRVFTMQGGDITMWTSNGSITAGSGAKTSVYNVPLSYTMSNDAAVAVDAFGLQTGAGIGVLDAIQNAQDRPRSRLDLIAPKGEVNAGDAGIRVIGDLNIAAQVVVGLENIQVSGASAGVPKVEVPNIGALTTASQLAQAAAKEGVGPEAQPRTTIADLPSVITVEVVGYEAADRAEGEEDRSPSRRKGQRHDPNREVQPKGPDDANGGK